ncbi:hypothetical protein V8C35DRAFT_101888 [Trichoderma chlorosporum]
MPETLRSSVRDPLPVITGLERPPQSTLDGIRNSFHGLLSSGQDSTPADEAKYGFSHKLIASIFRFLGTDSQRFPECFAMSVSLCKKAKILQTTSWNQWRDFKEFIVIMEKVERLTRQTGMLHCPNGPILVIAIALKKVVLHEKIAGQNDKLSRFLRDFDCYNKALTAIYFYDMNYRQRVITVDQQWNMAPFAIQRPPNRTRDQFNAGPLDQNTFTRIQAPNQVIILDDEPTPAKREPPKTYQALEIREKRPEDAVPLPATALMPTTMLTSAPAPAPLPASILAPTPAIVRETAKQVFRGDIMRQLQPLLDRLKSENWNGIIQRDIMQVLTDKNVRVLPSLAKNMLNIWATRSQNATLLSWLEQARDDVDVFQWTERYIEPTAHGRTGLPSAHAVFHELGALIAGISLSTVRDPIQAKMNTLKDIFEHQEKSHKDEMLYRVDSIQMEIAKIYSQMAESNQTDAQATGEPAAETDANFADIDEDFGVQSIEVVDDDEELEGRKRKKRKVEQKQPKKANGGKKKKKKKKRSHQEMEEN